MKNIKHLSLALLALTIFTVYSCKKDRIEKKQVNEYQSPNDYLDSKKQQEQEFIINGPSNDTLQGNQGTRVYGAKNCLQNSTGDTIDYPFTIKLVELYTPKDMIYYQIPTVAAGNILETDGEIRLRAFKGTEELTLKPSCPYAIEMPNAAPKNYMNIFYGSTGTIVDWTDSQVAFGTNAYGYIGSPTTLGWINCDKTIGTGTGHTLTFTSSTDNLQNVAIFIYFTGIKGVMQVYNMTSGLIPDGSNVKIVMIAVNSSGDLYTYKETRTVTSSSTIDVELTAISDADLTNHLDNL
ncbi:MAG: hypothetical protein J5I47_08645 [Vicingus serpentipes]|nr:hypothetical protein [Vicingus serpentipes]